MTTEEAKRRAILERCGWTNLGKTLGTPPGWTNGALVGLPDLLNDLNAMREAEISAGMLYIENYWWALVKATTGLEHKEFDPLNEYSCIEAATATASQRAEAFLEVIGFQSQ